jgi:hypothetical protein
VAQLRHPTIAKRSRQPGSRVSSSKSTKGFVSRRPTNPEVPHTSCKRSHSLSRGLWRGPASPRAINSRSRFLPPEACFRQLSTDERLPLWLRLRRAVPLWFNAFSAPERHFSGQLQAAAGRDSRRREVERRADVADVSREVRVIEDVESLINRSRGDAEKT